MKSELKSGVCVSCGRKAGRFYRTCPYCGERVWQPVWRRIACLKLLVISPLLVFALLWLAHADWSALARAVRAGHAWAAFLFAAGAGLLVLPMPDDDRVVSSQAELVRWQAVAVGGSLFCGALSLLAAVSLRFGRTSGAGVWALAIVVWISVAVAPLFFRIPWRAVAASALLAASVALR